jgi:hypothetical protein
VLRATAGRGLAYNGQPFINPGGGKPVYFGAPTAQQPAPPTPITPAAEVQVASSSLYNIRLDMGNCRVDAVSDYVSAALCFWCLAVSPLPGAALLSGCPYRPARLRAPTTEA